MQSDRQAQPPKGILDKKWVTYALTLLLLALIAVFVVSLRYQAEVIDFFKNLFRLGKKEPQRPTITINTIQKVQAKPTLFTPITIIN